MNYTNSAVNHSNITGKLISATGYLITLFFGLLSLIFFQAPYEWKYLEVHLVCTFIAMIGVFLIIKGIRIKRRLARFTHYVSLMSTEQMTSIPSIASNTSRPVAFVKKDLQDMINRKFFTNASINLTTEEIVFRRTDATSTLYHPEKVEKKTIYCPSCGAHRTKQNEKAEYCEYCGSLIG